MMCGHCTGKVERALSAVPGVTGVMVDLEGKCATVTGEAPAGALVAAVESVGFVATVAVGEGTAARSTILAVQGMMCGHCTGKVEASLSAVPGVRTVVVNLGAKRATVTGDATPADLIAAVEAVGFCASEMPSGGITLSVQGMHCASCTAKVEAALAAVPGAGAIWVEMDSGTATISVDLASGTASVEGVRPPEAAALLRAVEQAGFRAGLLESDRPAPTLPHETPKLSNDNGMPPAAPVVAPSVVAAAPTGSAGKTSSLFSENEQERGSAEDREELTPVLEPSRAEIRSSRTRLLATSAVPSNSKPRGRRGGGGERDRAVSGASREAPQEVGMSVMLGVSGMTCDSCRVGVERCLSGLVSQPHAPGLFGF
jgi:copper ion binding protein